jgi:hypothetical protein
MSTAGENKFKETLKTLVLSEPGKLSFYRGLEPLKGIPPFVPSAEYVKQTASEHAKRLEKQQIREAEVCDRKAKKRRKYAFGMAAAAACFVFFISIALVDILPRAGFDLPAPMAGIQADSPAETAETADAGAPETAEAAGAGAAETPAPGAVNGENEDESAGDVAPSPEPSDDRSSPHKTQASHNTTGGQSAAEIDESPAAASEAGTSQTGIIADVALVVAIIFAAIFIYLSAVRRKLR